MKKFMLLIFICNSLFMNAQKSAYGDGEWFKFRVHYGFVTAGYATLNTKATHLNGHEVYHIRGEGKTIGLSRLFFKVEDDYQSYIDIKKNIPYRFIRKIDEGGYTKDIQVDFNHNERIAKVNDKKHNEISEHSFPAYTQDMISAFYYMRNKLDTKSLKEGDVMDMNMFFDNENYGFKLKYLGKEVLNTTFGKISTLVFRPYVQSGRVFKEKESLTVWITADDNKIPLLVKADLAVGSLKATLVEFKGLQHPFEIIAK